MTDEIDLERRRFLTTVTTVVGGVGVCCTAVPFLASLTPTIQKKLVKTPVEVDLSQLQPGQKITVSWGGQPVFIVHRTAEVLQALQTHQSGLTDAHSNASDQPHYTQNIYRALNPTYFIAMAACTHLGCVPLYHPTPKQLGPDWHGGFLCPCHGAKYDLAGRVYHGGPAPFNLSIPPHRYLDHHIVLIGEDQPNVSS